MTRIGERKEHIVEEPLRVAPSFTPPLKMPESAPVYAPDLVAVPLKVKEAQHAYRV
jgi:hypothetical protein